MSENNTETIVSSLNLLDIRDNHTERLAASISTVNSAFENFRPRKTIAALLPAAEETIDAAVSGWSTWLHNLPGLDRVPQANVLGEVNRLMAQIGHPLCPDEKDGGVLGRYNACHAERLLVAHRNLNNPITGTLHMMINNEPCGDCYKFLARLELTLGLDIALLSRNETDYMEKKNHVLYDVWLSMFADLC